MTIAAKSIANAKGITFTQATTPLDDPPGSLHEYDTWFDTVTPCVRMWDQTDGWLPLKDSHYHIPALYCNLWSWGINDYGELGDKTTINKSSPVQVGSLTTWSKIACGYTHTLAIKTDGTLWGFGGNGTGGEIGDGTTINKVSPVQIGSLTDWSVVAAGHYFSIAIKTDGTLWSWGFQDQGQLGISIAGSGVSMVGSRSSPVQVGSLTIWSKISCGEDHTLAITTDGKLWAWGDNTYGELGTLSIVLRSSPVQVGSLTTWAAIGAGHNYSVVIKTNGTLWTWGYNNNGQLGSLTTIDRSSPVQVGSLTNWLKVACGDEHTLAIKTDGTLWSWSDNYYGSIGDNTRIYKSSPVQVGSLTTWIVVGAGNSFSAGITTDGKLFTWGDNNSGELALSNRTKMSSPTQVGSLTVWSNISCGWNYFMVGLQ